MVCVDRDFQRPGRTGPGTSCARVVRTCCIENTAAVKACCRKGEGHVTLNSALNLEREPHVQLCHLTLLNEICGCRQLRMRKRGGELTDQGAAIAAAKKITEGLRSMHGLC